MSRVSAFLSTIFSKLADIDPSKLPSEATNDSVLDDDVDEEPLSDLEAGQDGTEDMHEAVPVSATPGTTQLGALPLPSPPTGSPSTKKRKKRRQKYPIRLRPMSVEESRGQFGHRAQPAPMTSHSVNALMNLEPLPDIQVSTYVHIFSVQCSDLNGFVRLRPCDH